MATNNPVILAYFKGTGLSFPFEVVVEELMGFINEKIKSYDEDDVEFYYEQTSHMDKAMSDESGNGDYSSTATLTRVAKKCGFETLEGFITIWFCNIQYLLKKGRIQSNDKFGFQLISSPDTSSKDILKTIKKQMKKEFQVCGLCSQHAKTLCSKCKKVYYCCREHQVSDWKAHKKNCVA